MVLFMYRPQINRPPIPDTSNTYLSKTTIIVPNVTPAAPPKPKVDERVAKLQVIMY